MFIIYQITNVINNKLYFGITKTSLAKRWSSHKSEARRKPVTKFHKAIRKYGEDAWSVTELTRCKGADCASFLEDALITGYDTIANGYNGCPGGYQSTKQPGYKHTPEAYQKMLGNASIRKTPVYQFDENGVLVQQWESSVDAAIGVYNDRTANSNITKCAKRYKGQTYIRKAGFPPYSFGYTTECPVSAVEAQMSRIHSGLPKRCMAINQYDLNGMLLQQWNSVAEAARALDIPAASVQRVVAGKMGQTHGYKFAPLD